MDLETHPVFVFKKDLIITGEISIASLDSMVSNDDLVDCPFGSPNHLDKFDDEAMITSVTDTSVTSTATHLLVDLSTVKSNTFYVKFESIGLKNVALPVEYHVCLETSLALSKSPSYIKTLALNQNDVGLTD